MKKRTLLLWGILPMLFFSISCKKRIESFELQQQLQWLNYTGSNEQVKKLIDELKQPGFSATLLSDCNTCMPAWDKLIVIGRIGDSLSYTLVPVLNKQDIAEAYIKIAREKNTHVKQVSTYSYNLNYVNDTDLYKKALTGIHFKQLASAGIRVPTGFSSALAEKQYLKAIKAISVTRRSSNTPKAKGARIDAMCTTDFDIWYEYNSCTEPETVTEQFLLFLDEQLAAATGDRSSYTITVGTYITVVCSQDIPAEYYASQAWGQTANVNPCIVGQTRFDVMQSCDGSNPPSQTDTVNPCIQKAQISTLMSNPIIAFQNSQIIAHLTSGIEYATEYNLIDWSTPGAGYMPTPVRTNNNSDEIVGEFNWNSTDGYAIGFVHNHPNGTGPSPDDIFELIEHLQGNIMSAATEAEREYYMKNATLTVFTPDNTYVVTINNLVDLAGIFSQFSADPQGFDDQVVADGTTYHSYEVAILKTFGRSINVYSAPAGTTDFTPLTVSDTNHSTAYPCN